MTIQDVIREVKENEEIDWSKDFVDAKIFDSLEIMTLVEKLEEYFNCEIKGSEIIPENFVSIETIERMLLRNGGEM